jgi:uncharacterized protein YbjT (DUF2867 family)
MSERRIIAVVGATGAQGGGLVRAILRDGRFAARALTRQPEGEKARALAAAGSEVVHADLDDVESVAAAFQGAHGAFLVTNFWEHFSPEREGRQARNLADAAKRAGVAHVVWSTLEDTRAWVPLDDARMPTLQGRYKVPHFDAKAEADAYFRELGVPTTFLRTSFYWDNFIHFGMGPVRGADGVLALNLPMGDKPLAGIAAADIGACAYGVFALGEAAAGRTIGIAGEHLTGAEMAAKMSRALGEPVRYQDVPLDVYRGLGFPGADDLGNMFQCYQEFADEFTAQRPVDASRALYPGLRDFDAWLAEHAKALAVAPAVPAS